MKRKDLLEASKLLRRNKLDSTDPAAMMLAIGYLNEKASGETEKPFTEWLDEEVEDDDELEESDPT